MWIELDPEEVESRGMEYVQERILHYQSPEDDPRAEKYRQAEEGMAEEGVLGCDPDAVVSLGDVEDSRWPWCEPCQSYHHPKNLTCRKLWAKEYTLMAGEAWLWVAEGKWNSPRDGQRGHMMAAWVSVGPIHEREMRAAGIDLPKYPGEWQLLEPLEVHWELRVACMRGMIEAKSHWADGRKKRSGDPGQDWRREIVGKG